VRQHGNRLIAAACAAAFLLAFFGVQAFAQAPTWGEVRVVEHPVSVRHRPDPAAPLVRTMKVGDKVRVDFVQPNGWAALFDLTEPQRDLTKAIGYAELKQLTPLAQARIIAPAPTRKPVASKPAARASGSSEVKGEVKESPPLLSGGAPASTPQDPVHITSDRMVYSQTENAVVFIGNVHGTQKDMAIWAAKITAYFTEKNDGKAGQKGQKDQKGGQKGGQEAGQAGGQGDFGSKIDRIVAEGSVRLVSGKNEGACSRLVYHVADGVIRMEGNPILRDGQNTVRGDVIKFYIHENRSEVLSGTQRRVEAIFYQQDKGAGK